MTNYMKSVNKIIIEVDNAIDTYVRTSGVEGVGLFASRDFQKGETLVDFFKSVKSHYVMKFSDLSDEQIRKNWYIPINDEYCVTCDKWTKYSYINHSRTPNSSCEIVNGKVKADRFIKKDDEILMDYRCEYRPNRISFPNWI